MARQLLLAFRFASYVAALIPLVVPNTLLAGSAFSGAGLASQALSQLSETIQLYYSRNHKRNRASHNRTQKLKMRLQKNCPRVLFS